MTSSTHISLETLASIAEKRGTPETSEAAMTHIAACSTCHEKLSRLQQLIVMMRSDSSTDAPRDVLTAALNIFSHEKHWPLRRIVALLTFDSRDATPAFGMRSLFATSRQMLYSAEETDLDLRVTRLNDEYVLAGQVIGGLVMSHFGWLGSPVQPITIAKIVTTMLLRKINRQPQASI